MAVLSVPQGTYDRTFMHFLLEHQEETRRSLNFLILMEAIVTAAMDMQHQYNIAAIQGNLGATDEENVQGETVMTLDKISHSRLVHHLWESKQVLELTSEEAVDPILLNENGRYLVYCDPLDGSSNVRHNLPVGFLFGIAKRSLLNHEDLHLRAGKEFIAAGMFLIPSGIFTFALKDSGTWRFIRDPSGTYLRPTRITLPTSDKTWELSWNSGYRKWLAPKVKQWLDDQESKYSFRYAGSLAVDFHRLLDNGGLFLYPALFNRPAPKRSFPKGKLRLMYECAVVAFLAKEAGGLAINEQGEDILDIIPEYRHQRSTLFVGNPEMVSAINEALGNP